MMKWGFIGCGSVVEHKSGKPFWKEGESEVVAVMCRTLSSATAFAEKHNIPNVYDDVEALIANPDVQAVYIATPPSTHMPYARLAIEAGKAVYVEKPMGMNTQECEEIVALAKQKNVPLFVAYYRRGLPYFQTMKRLLDGGKIGKIRSVNVVHYKKKPEDMTVTWRRIPAISGGGLFHDLAAHTLDILEYLIAPIQTAQGMHANQRALFESDDTISACFQFENGVLGAGIWSFDVEEDLETVEILGDAGKIVFSVFGNRFDVIKDGKCETTEFTHPDFIQEPLIHNMIAALQGKETALSTGETAIRTTKVMDAITQ